MKLVCHGSQDVPCPRVFSCLHLFVGASLALALAAVTGCGGSGGTQTITPPPQGNTEVTFLLSTAADDRLTQYHLNFQDLTLTSQSGKAVSVLATPQNNAGPYSPEFMHLNSESATLLTASVPDDTYTSATLTVGGADFTCIAVDPSDNSLTTSTFAYGQTPQSQVTVNLPSPIAISGNTMTLLMQLQMPQSYTLGNCIGGSITDPYSITPTFNLTVANLSSPPTSYLNGKESDVLGQVSATSSNSFSITEGYDPNSPASLPVQSIIANSNTVYQGIGGLSDLAQGMFVDMDLAAQPDGSLLATRVAVQDTNAVDMLEGPLVQTASSIPAFFMFGQQVQGPDLIGNTMPYDMSKGVFKISGQFANLATLPFTPVFNASNLVPGQNVYITTPAYSDNGVNGYPLLNTVTLMPQTIEGTIASTQSTSGFSIYVITLPSYNLFVDLAGQPGATNLVAKPSQVVVYADNNTQLVNATEPATGSTMRFHGLVFNDQGTLRMDCDEIDNGVSQPLQASGQAAAASKTSQAGAAVVESAQPAAGSIPARLIKTTLFPKVP